MNKPRVIVLPTPHDPETLIHEPPRYGFRIPGCANRYTSTWCQDLGHQCHDYQDHKDAIVRATAWANVYHGTRSGQLTPSQIQTSKDHQAIAEAFDRLFSRTLPGHLDLTGGTR